MTPSFSGAARNAVKAHPAASREVPAPHPGPFGPIRIPTLHRMWVDPPGYFCREPGLRDVPSDHAPLAIDLDQPGRPFDAGWTEAEARIAARRTR